MDSFFQSLSECRRHQSYLRQAVPLERSSKQAVLSSIPPQVNESSCFGGTFSYWNGPRGVGFKSMALRGLPGGGGGGSGKVG